MCHQINTHTHLTRPKNVYGSPTHVIYPWKGSIFTQISWLQQVREDVNNGWWALLYTNTTTFFLPLPAGLVRNALNCFTRSWLVTLPPLDTIKSLTASRVKFSTWAAMFVVVMAASAGEVSIAARHLQKPATPTTPQSWIYTLCTHLPSFLGVIWLCSNSVVTSKALRCILNVDLVLAYLFSDSIQMKLWLKARFSCVQRVY